MKEILPGVFNIMKTTETAAAVDTLPWYAAYKMLAGLVEELVSITLNSPLIPTRERVSEKS